MQDTAERGTIERSSAVRKFGERLGTSWLGLGRTWVVSMVALVVCAGLFFASDAGFAVPTVADACGEAPLDVRPYSSAQQVHEFLESCSSEGRSAYRSMQVADLFYPAVFGLFVTSSLVLLLRRLFPDRPEVLVLAGLGIAATMFDYIENAAAWRALATFPQRSWSDHVLGIASLLKSASSWMAMAVLAIGLVALGARQAVRLLPRTAS